MSILALVHPSWPKWRYIVVGQYLSPKIAPFSFRSFNTFQFRLTQRACPAKNANAATSINYGEQGTNQEELCRRRLWVPLQLDLHACFLQHRTNLHTACVESNEKPLGARPKTMTGVFRIIPYRQYRSRLIGSGRITGPAIRGNRWVIVAPRSLHGERRRAYSLMQCVRAC